MKNTNRQARRGAFALFLCALTLLCCIACGNGAPSAEEGAEYPEDFSFSIVWGCYGISSYDSRTGKLVKTKDTDDVDRYTATVKLSVRDRNTVYRCLFSDIDLTEYPNVYDPFNAPDAKTRVHSDPNQTVIVSATAGGRSKTVTCRDVALCSVKDCFCAEAKAFWTSVTEITDLLASLPEWAALPEVEKFYQ